MKIKKLLLVVTICLFLCVVLSATTSADFSPHKAKKIEFFLKKIAKAKKTKVFLRKGSFSEDELNSYLNLVYAKRYAPEVKYMKLTLKEKNQVKGTMKVKLAGKKYKDVPSFLRDFEIEFTGTIESGKYKMRYLFEELRINGAHFSPELLDEAFGAAQGRVKDKKSLFDWFDFLPGIKKIAIDYKKITFFY